ncbi:hypothetical protein [Sphingosinicella microcystinivorans]|uniref:Uncharacterized protein n=1 Tax=Sphingosinicella microcystinivorans TaxID=335406 RepID=A0AAD1D889_SPHMI|nr:hypothetical protein [Sphingosinicella microcystinivorans]RKS86323.1 hypothetical protein DFR51_3026 [Sphingosinicella microcystinivorans]BBE35631.1 hypothetical protein SmB9_32890 [Sphingosinicella microcystinivorans]
MSADLQYEMVRTARGAVIAVDSAADITEVNRGSDVMVTASYIGVLPARLAMDHAPRAVLGFDGGVGPEGAGMAGVWYYEALNVPAAAIDVMSIILGDGVDAYENGVVSFANRPARDCGVEVGMAVSTAARLMLDNDPGLPSAYQVTNRTSVEQGPDGREVIVTDSIVFGIEADKRNVLVTAGHTGRSGARHIETVRPFGFICSDGGRGRNDSGMAGLPIVNAAGIAGATVDARLARLGDGMSTYRDGIISAANELALACGVRIGMAAREAASLLVNRKAD